MRRIAFHHGCCALALIALAAPAHAQDAADASRLPDTPAEQRQVYTPADFAQFNPRTALDMVQQLPGFSIEGSGGFNQARGLGQASGNVLLNGARIVTKSGSISDELGRIPAGNVIRIELVEGSTLNIPGLSGRVANVVARSSDGLQGQFEWRPQLPAEFADGRWAEGIVSVSGTLGRLGFTVAVEGRPNRNGNGGLNYVKYGDGRVEERYSETNSHGDDKRLSTALKYRTPGGLVANFNASYLRRRFHSFDNEIVIGPAGAPPLTDEFNQRNRGHDLEFGGDVDFALGPGRLKLIGLDSYQSITMQTQSVVDPATGAPATGSQFHQTSDRGERIGRGEYSWNMWGADWQWSFEGAFNRLDQQGDLFLLGPNGVFVQLPFAAGTGGVREDRYESMLSFSHSLTDNLSLQLIGGGEYSNIRQTGTAPNSRTFVRPKGTLTLAWAPAENLDVTFRIDRRVGQLNFSDFLAAVNLNSNNASGTNNELRPDQSWGAEIEATRDFGAWGSANFRVFARRFEDYITFIPRPGGGEVRGNVDWARVMGAELNGTLKFDPLGLRGAKLDLAASVRDSIYPDPVEQRHLPVQNAQPYNVELDFRYDVPRSDWAFGAGYRNTGFNNYYRVSEYGVDYAIDENVTVFVEHKDLFGLTVQARLSNILEREAVLQRSVFQGPRSGGVLLFSEDRRREIGKVVNLTVKGSF